MKKVLIVGATGFIGKKVADYLSQDSDYEIIRYTRQPKKGFLSCKIGDSIWLNTVRSCEAIINCSGVGLAKIKQQKGANEAIARQLVDSLPEENERKYRILHLSSVKAFNVNNYPDDYSNDKQRAESVFIAHGNKLQGELLRIPAVFGADDANLTPLLRIAEKGHLPEIDGDVCSWHCISDQDVANYISDWLSKQGGGALTRSYLLSQQRYNVNDLIKAINYHVHGPGYHAKKKKILYIKFIYQILSIKSYVFSGFRWSRFPSERFLDLFHRNWEVEENILLHTVIFEPADIWSKK